MFFHVLAVCLFVTLSAAQSDSPGAIVVHPPTYSTAATSQTVRMTCAAYGVPKPSITWSRGSGDLAAKLAQSNSNYKQYDKTVTVNGTDFLVSVLEICDVSVLDTDEYSCMADNGIVGTPIASSDASFFLSVSGAASEPPAVIVRPPAEQTSVDYGSTVEAVCVAYGNPLPYITWSKDGCTDLSCSKNAMMYDEVVTYGDVSFRKSIVQLCNVSEMHTGSYTCRASNGIGGEGVAPSSFSWQLSVKPRPPATTSVSIPAPPTTTCPTYTIPSVSMGRATTSTAAPSAGPTERLTSESYSETTYVGIVVVLAVIIVILLIVVVVVIVIAVRMRSNPHQKAEIAIPPKDPRVMMSVENPIHKDEDEQGLVGDDDKEGDTMTYADLAKKMEAEAGND